MQDRIDDKGIETTTDTTDATDATHANDVTETIPPKARRMRVKTKIKAGFKYY